MSYLRRLVSFLFISVFIGYSAYFGILNMEKLYVNVPFFGEYRVVGFLAFVTAFVLGGLFAALFFGYDFFRKSFEIRRSRKALVKIQKDPHQRVSRFLEEESQTIRREPFQKTQS
jgi:uncharacterized integral membrane protein